MHEIIKTDSLNKDFIKLVKLLDADLAIRDGDEHEFYHQFNKIDKINNAIVFYFDNGPVGCGAFKFYDNSTVEIKRMFVLPNFRGKGIAFKILNELENWAKELKFNSFILETGVKQPEAIALYKKAFYEVIPNYDQYIGMNNSICMKKRI